MPHLSAWFVRAALLHFAAGITLGGLLLAQKGVSFFPALWVTLPAHMEFLLMGWIAQLAMGVGYWILPRFGRGAARGHEHFTRASFYLINAGIVAVVIQPWFSFTWLALIGRLLQALAVVFYVLGIWRRVKPFGV